MSLKYFVAGKHVNGSENSVFENGCFVNSLVNY